MYRFIASLSTQAMCFSLLFLGALLPLSSHAADSVCGFISIGNDEDSGIYMLNEDGSIVEDESEAELQAVPPEVSLKRKLSGVSYTLLAGSSDGQVIIKAKKSIINAKKTIRDAISGFFVDDGLYIIRNNGNVYKVSLKKSGRKGTITLKTAGDFEETECYAEDDLPPDEELEDPDYPEDPNF